MSGIELIRARLTIWRPYFAGRMLALRDGDGTQLKALTEDDELQREVFSWSVTVNVWGGLSDEKARSALSDRFGLDFEATRLPSDRSMAVFGAFVRDLGLAASSQASEWSTTDTEAGDAGTENPRLNGLLAFHNQLEWLHDMYCDLPGASVSVR